MAAKRKTRSKMGIKMDTMEIILLLLINIGFSQGKLNENSSICIFNLNMKGMRRFLQQICLSNMINKCKTESFSDLLKVDFKKFDIC